jgi:hypothetical protein
MSLPTFCHPFLPPCDHFHLKPPSNSEERYTCHLRRGIGTPVSCDHDADVCAVSGSRLSIRLDVQDELGTPCVTYPVLSAVANVASAATQSHSPALHLRLKGSGGRMNEADMGRILLDSEVLGDDWTYRLGSLLTESVQILAPPGHYTLTVSPSETDSQYPQLGAIEISVSVEACLRFAQHLQPHPIATWHDVCVDCPAHHFAKSAETVCMPCPDNVGCNGREPPQPINSYQVHTSAIVCDFCTTLYSELRGCLTARNYGTLFRTLQILFGKDNELRAIPCPVPGACVRGDWSVRNYCKSVTFGSEEFLACGECSSQCVLFLAIALPEARFVHCS